MKIQKLTTDLYLETLDGRCSGWPIYKHRVKTYGRQITWDFSDWAALTLGTFCLWNIFQDGRKRLHINWPAWMIKYDTVTNITEFYISEEAVSLVVLKWQE